MSLLDDYQNMDEAGSDETASGDPADARRKRGELERQVVILQSDLKKLEREIEDFEQQKRKFKKEEERLRVERDELDKNLKIMENNRLSLEEEIGRLKKQLKNLIS